MCLCLCACVCVRARACVCVYVCVNHASARTAKLSKSSAQAKTPPRLQRAYQTTFNREYECGPP